MLIDWIPLLFLGFGLGLMHALDADHVMAVSTLANQRPGIKRTLVFSLNWALGHGGVLLCCGALLFGLGVQIPDEFQHAAELSVGVILIVLGLSFFWTFRKNNIQLTAHRHDDIVHTHWSEQSHGHEESTSGSNTKGTLLMRHQPVMIGMLHGLAGSAPALALIPAVSSGQIQIAVSYLLVFSLGVVLSMLVFGLGFSWLQSYLYQYYQRAFVVCRQLIALLAIAFGSFWIVQALSA